MSDQEGLEKHRAPSETSSTLDERSFRTIAYISGLGGLTLAVLYLFGFWGSFGLNALQFIGFGDVLAYALFPILALASAQLLPFALGRLIATSRPSPAPPPDALVLFWRKYWWLFVALSLVGYGVVSRLISEPDRTVLTFPLLYFLVVVLTSRAVLTGELRAEMRTLVLMATVLGLGIFATGRIDAYKIITGEGALVVDTLASELHLNPNSNHSVSYVGHLSDFYVLYESEGSRIIILRTDKISPLVLLKNPKLQPALTPTVPSPLPTAIIAPTRS
jgi:hypothetical protein